MAKHFIIEDVERTIEHISKKQKGDLINKIRDSGFITLPWFFHPISPGLHVFVKYPKKDHPMAFNSCLPVGFIGRNYAELVNLFQPGLDNYHSKLRKIYYSVE